MSEIKICQLDSISSLQQYFFGKKSYLLSSLSYFIKWFTFSYHFFFYCYLLASFTSYSLTHIMINLSGFYLQHQIFFLFVPSAANLMTIPPTKRYFLIQGMQNKLANGFKKGGLLWDLRLDVCC